MQGLAENGHIVGGNTDFPLQGQQVVPTEHGRILTTMDETVDSVSIETGSRETGGIDTDQHVGIGDILIVLVHGLIIDNLHQDAERGVQPLSRPQRVLQGNANDHIGTHGPRQVNGIVVGEETVDQHHIPFADRGKDGGNGHGGTHGLRQATGVDIHLGIVNNIRSHTGEGNGQTVETHRVGITQAQLLEQGTDILALDETTASLALTAEGKRTGDDVGALFLAVANALATDVLTVAEEKSPVKTTHQGVECLGIVANGIEAAHKTSHRGSRDNINGDASAF